MSTTTLTAPEIRRILGDTRGRSAAEIEAAQQAERAFRDTQPVRGTQCRSCPCMVFTAAEHPNGTRAWVCGKCRRPVLATDAEWQAEEKRRAKAADRIAPKRPVAKPLPPREALQAAIDDREAIAASISALQSGRSAARARLGDAERLVSDAAEALRNAEALELEHSVGVAVGSVNGRTRAPLATAARSTLADAESALELAQTTEQEIRRQTH